MTRLDLFLARKTGLARNQVRRMIEQGGVTLSGKVVTKPSHKVSGAEQVDYVLPSVALSSPAPPGLAPEAIPLDILYEDEVIAVVNKPAGLVVHPAPGHPSRTLVNALLARYGQLPEGSEPNKPGIVHRLDQGTSGCLVVARTADALRDMSRQFKERKVEKIYLALVAGRLAKEGFFDKPLGRHPIKRQKISSRTRKGREALTEWKVLENFGEAFSWVEIRLHTGRTHQIRVHFSESGHPVAGDPVYGRRRKTCSEWISRPALHAWRLRLAHPSTGETLSIEAPIPEDLRLLLQKLRAQA